METLVIAVVVILLIGLAVVLFMRKFSSPETTTETLLGMYRTFERRDASEEERLFQMLATRGGWRSLPGPFLRELTKRLASKEDLIALVILAERHGLLESNLARIASSALPDPESTSFAVDQVAVTLMGLHSHLAQRAILGPGFAMIGGEWRPLGGKWAVRINRFLGRTEAVLRRQTPEDDELAFRLARRIEQRQRKDV